MEKEIINNNTICKEHSVVKIEDFIYFLSNEPIKEGDWCINKNRDTLYQLNNITISRAGVEFWDKIIATTNPDLW